MHVFIDHSYVFFGAMSIQILHLLLKLFSCIMLASFFNIYLFMAVLGLRCCKAFSLAVASEGYSPVAVLGRLIAVASHCGAWASVAAARGVSSCSPWPLEHRLCSFGTLA